MIKNDLTSTFDFVPSDSSNVKTMFFRCSDQGCFRRTKKWNDFRIHQIMSNEDGKSMGLALILPLLLYIVYLIREIRVSRSPDGVCIGPFENFPPKIFQSHLERKSRIKRWTLYRLHKEAKLKKQNQEITKYPSLVDLPGEISRLGLVITNFNHSITRISS